MANKKRMLNQQKKKPAIKYVTMQVNDPCN